MPCPFGYTAEEEDGEVDDVSEGGDVEASEDGDAGEHTQRPEKLPKVYTGCCSIYANTRGTRDVGMCAFRPQVEATRGLSVTRKTRCRGSSRTRSGARPSSRRGGKSCRQRPRVSFDAPCSRGSFWTADHHAVISHAWGSSYGIVPM